MPTDDWLIVGKEWLVQARESVRDEYGNPITQDDFAHRLRASGLLPPHRARVSDRRVRAYEADGRWPQDMVAAFQDVTGLRFPETAQVIRGRARKDHLGELENAVFGHEERLGLTEQRLIAVEQRLELLANELADLGSRLSDTHSAAQGPGRRGR